MAYMTITPLPDDSLLLRRSPGLLSKCLFLGCIVSGFGAAWFGSDMLVWRVVCVLASFYIGNIILDTWEECRLDSPRGEITLTKYSLLENLFPCLWKSEKCVIPMNEVEKVSVQSRNFSWFGTGFQIFFEMENRSAALTREWTIGHKREFTMIAEQIQDYLHLAKIRHMKEDHTHHDTDDYLGDSSSSESFEHLDYEEIRDMIKSMDPQEIAGMAKGLDREEMSETCKSTDPQQLADRIKSWDCKELVELVKSWDHPKLSDMFENMDSEEIAESVKSWDPEEIAGMVKGLDHEMSEKLKSADPQQLADRIKSWDRKELVDLIKSWDHQELSDSFQNMDSEEIADLIKSWNPKMIADLLKLADALVEFESSVPLKTSGTIESSDPREARDMDDNSVIEST